MNTVINDPIHKILSPAMVDRLKHMYDGKLVVVDGIFDNLSRPVIEFLYEASRLGNALLVLVESDVSAKHLDGEAPDRSQDDRIYTTAGIGCVDFVLPVASLKRMEMLSKMKPAVYAQSAVEGVYILNAEDKRDIKSLGICTKDITLTKSGATNRMLETMSKISQKGEGYRK